MEEDFWTQYRMEQCYWGKVTFRAPEIKQKTDVEFTLTVTDSHSTKSFPAKVIVTMEPPSDSTLKECMDLREKYDKLSEGEQAIRNKQEVTDSKIAVNQGHIKDAKAAVATDEANLELQKKKRQ